MAHKYERSFMVSEALDTRASNKSNTEEGGEWVKDTRPHHRLHIPSTHRWSRFFKWRGGMNIFENFTKKESPKIFQKNLNV